MLTPRLLNLLLLRHEHACQMQFATTATLTAIVANAMREKGSHAFSPWDFIPGMKPPAQTPDDMVALLRSMTKPKKEMD